LNSITSSQQEEQGTRPVKDCGGGEKIAERPNSINAKSSAESVTEKRPQPNRKQKHTEEACMNGTDANAECAGTLRKTGNGSREV